MRHLRLENAAVLDRQALKAIVSDAGKLAVVPFDEKQSSKLVIKSVSAKQRPRRPA